MKLKSEKRPQGREKSLDIPSADEHKIPEEASHYILEYMCERTVRATVPLTIFRSPDDSGDARLTVSYIGQREEQGGRNGN